MTGHNYSHFNGAEKSENPRQRYVWKDLMKNSYDTQIKARMSTSF